MVIYKHREEIIQKLKGLDFMKKAMALTIFNELLDTMAEKGYKAMAINYPRITEIEELNIFIAKSYVTFIKGGTIQCDIKGIGIEDYEKKVREFLEKF